MKESTTIDHHVPLAEAHRAGAWRWNDDTKQRFANDDTAGALNIVSGDVNQAKADQRPDQWLPPTAPGELVNGTTATVAAVKRWGLAVIAVLVASCASSPNATDPAAAAEVIDTDEGRDHSLDASRDASRLAALDVRTTGCGPREGFGSAALIDDGLAITAAHVVAGVDDITVVDQRLVEHAASVVLFDPDLDIALLRVPTGLGTPLEFFDGRVEVGDVGAITVVRERNDAGEPVTLDVSVLRRANVVTTDIYRDLDVVRPGFEIAAEITPGDSGAVVVLAGRVAGVVWSRSIERDGRAWVVNIPEPYRDMDRHRSVVETGECT